MKRRGGTRVPPVPAALPSPDAVLYQKWLAFLFDRQHTHKKWYNLDDTEFEASPDELVALIGLTCRRAGTDLKRFSDRQVADGLNYIFNNAASNVIFAICQKGVDGWKRVAAVEQMQFLYSDCLAKRCAPLLGHLNEGGDNDLNMLCYMLWDSSPLCNWKGVVIEVMEAALYLPNPACVESALHGLGHRVHHDAEIVEAIINRFLSKLPGLRPELRQYAINARAGCIN